MIYVKVLYLTLHLLCLFTTKKDVDKNRID